MRDAESRIYWSARARARFARAMAGALLTLTAAIATVAGMIW